MTEAAVVPHWENVYRSKGDLNVSWYEPVPTDSLALVAELPLAPEDPIVDVGAGASRFADQLLARGMRQITLLDLSETALGLTRARLVGTASEPEFVVSDVLAWQPKRTFRLWHDRAVFHFLVDKAMRAQYIDKASAWVATGGHILLATFAPDGPDKCSGLPVTRYSAEELYALFDKAFVPAGARQVVHTTPWGSRQAFTYAMLRRL